MGVETDAHMRFLAAEACDEAQGYLISKPQPIERFAEQIDAPETFVPPGRPDAAVA